MQTTAAQMKDAETINPAIPSRWILNCENRAQTYTYTSMDGVERVAYNDAETLPDYMARNPGYKIVSEAEYDAIQATYYESMKTKPSEITEDAYWYYLECLPPCRYDGNVFHVSERLTGNLVQWCFGKKGKYYGFTDDASISAEKLREIFDSV